MNEDFLRKKIEQRKEQHAYRSLRLRSEGVDFCSNDYLGVVTNKLLPVDDAEYKTGSTGSRLLAGNSVLVEKAEKQIAAFHQATAALIFNSGYDANLGLLSCVPQRGDTVFYDYLSHASIRDGLRLSLAQSFSFVHNDLADLRKKMEGAKGNIFVVTESVFSMDGDTAPLAAIADLCKLSGAHLIVDEAHATGILGDEGAGLVQALGIQDSCFARVHTFGKAMGCHGAVVLGSDTLRHYLINFCRSFIYTTALPEVSIAAIMQAYQLVPQLKQERKQLQLLADLFQSAGIPFQKTVSRTAIQSVIVPGNENIRAVAARCQQSGLDTRAILYPTVPKDTERLRIVLHAFNTTEELHRLLEVIQESSK